MDEQDPMEPGDWRMRDVILQLALLSNGRTSSFAASSGGEPDHTPTLGAGDAPHLEYARRWGAATTDGERRAVYNAARSRLRRERKGSGAGLHVVVESREQLDARIVRDGEGVEAGELAIRFRTGVTVVRKARLAAGRETEYGKPPRRPGSMTADERDREARRLNDEHGMNAHDISRALGCSYNTVRRALGRLAS